MKLYATIKSERATKGQGGNKYLEIEIKAEGLEDIPTRANIYRLRLTTDNGVLNASLLDYSSGHEQSLIHHRSAREIELINAKRQKDDNICPQYNEQIMPDENGNCSLCGEKHEGML